MRSFAQSGAQSKEQASNGSAKQSIKTSLVNEVLQSSGHPLDASTREFMESRFDHDFSRVRVHTDSKAAESASSVNALAYTTGNNIVFGNAQYAPATSGGQRLLAHELTHVVQQRSGVHLKESVGEIDDYYERQADEAAESVMNNRRPSFPRSSGVIDFTSSVPLIQRKQRKESPETEKSPETTTTQTANNLQTNLPDGGCTFELLIKDKVSKKEVKYCFVAEPDADKANLYHLTAFNPDDESVRYSIDVSINTRDKIISIDYPMVINMTGKNAAGKNVNLSVPYQHLQNAWNASPHGKNIASAGNTAASGGNAAALSGRTASGELIWDFVVLEVYDVEKKELPRRNIYWMDDWSGTAPPAKTTNAKVATFRIDSDEFNRVAGGEYYQQKTGTRMETLRVTQVNQLIAGKTPSRTSDTGFDPNTFVGALLTRPSFGVWNDEEHQSKSHVSFAEAAGKETLVEEGHEPGTRRVSVGINPYKTIKANFKSNESNLPEGLVSSSLAEFNSQMRLVLLYLQDTPGINIKIQAYTDTVGTFDANKTLSEQRAASAKKYLTDKTIWTGANGKPKALEGSQIIGVEGKGQADAEKEMKKKYSKEWAKLQNKPTEWAQFIGAKANGDNADFRKFEIEYILQ